MTAFRELKWMFPVYTDFVYFAVLYIHEHRVMGETDEPWTIKTKHVTNSPEDEQYTVRNVETTTALFRANTSYMVVPASLLVIVTSYYPHHAKLQTSSTCRCYNYVCNKYRGLWRFYKYFCKCIIMQFNVWL